MPLSKEQVIQNIRTAFRGVKLGDGIGLWQAQAIDDYKPVEEQIRQRERDEKENWEAISIEDLDQCYSSLSFFDADGMRFHLPAFLIAELQEVLRNPGPVFSIAWLSDYNEGQFASLSTDQCIAVRDFLELIRDDRNYEADWPHIDMALLDFWMAKAETA
jgi:hypothetical protein